jgi:L-methionine (R)-S-oxide reductase
MNMNHIDIDYPENKAECYRVIHEQLKSLLENETNVIPNLSNTSALLYNSLKDINWAGFYLTSGTGLLLGPFQGKPACIRIPWGKGVCGSAASLGKTVVVPDVHKFPGHIACDPNSRSEIVVPIIIEDKTAGVLDIDSPIPDRFDDDDKKGLEEVVRLLSEGCTWSQVQAYPDFVH